MYSIYHIVLFLLFPLCFFRKIITLNLKIIDSDLLKQFGCIPLGCLYLNKCYIKVFCNFCWGKEGVLIRSIIVIAILIKPKNFTQKSVFLAWGTLSTQGIVILSGVVVVVVVRRCRSRLSVSQNRVPTQNLRTVVGIDLLFFLIDWYEWGGVQSETKFWKRREEKVWNR